MQSLTKASQRPDVLHFWEFVNEDPIGNSSGMIRKEHCSIEFVLAQEYDSLY
jgi:hypothetical protein